MIGRRSLLGFLAGLPFVGKAVAQDQAAPMWKTIAMYNPTDDPIVFTYRPVGLGAAMTGVVPPHELVGCFLQDSEAFVSVGGLVFGAGESEMRRKFIENNPKHSYWTGQQRDHYLAGNAVSRKQPEQAVQ